MFKTNKIITIASLLFLLFFSCPVRANTESSELLQEVNELFFAGDYQSAAAMLEEASPENIAGLDKSDYLEKLALIYYEMGDLSRYIENLSLINSRVENDPNLKLQLAIAYEQAGEHQPSAAIFHELVSELQESEEQLQSLNSIEQKRFFYYLGQNAYSRREKEQAQSFWEAGLSLEQGQSLFLVRLAELNEEKGNTKNALGYYQEAIAEDRSLNYLYPEIASLQEELGEYEEALEYWTLSKNTGIQEDLAAEKIAELDLLLELDTDIDLTISEDYSLTYDQEKPQLDFDLYSQQDLTLEATPEWTWEPDWQEVAPLPEYPQAPDLEIGIASPRSNIILQVDDNFVLENERGEVILSDGAGYTEYEIAIEDGYLSLWEDREHLLTLEGSEELTLIPAGDNSSTIVQGVQYGAGYFFAGSEDRQYRGKMHIRPTGDESIQLVNEVNLEEYLLSVVPAEMSPGWPEEALKAQTLAARSFALHNQGRRQASHGFDLFDTVSDAVYAGVGREHPRTREAITATAGEIGVYQGEPVNAVFSSNSGGHTESSQAVWGGDIDYLSPSALNHDESQNAHQEQDLASFSPVELQEWFHSRPETYSGSGPYSSSQAYRWIREIDLDFIKSEFNLKTVEDFKIVERSERGFVKEINIVGADETGSQEVVQLQGDEIRSSLGGLRSNSFILHRLQDSSGNLTRIIIYGGGWGHGVGMDQTAAGNMAEQGWNYQDIFRHFYQDISIDNIYQ